MVRAVERLSRSDDQKADMINSVGDLSKIELLNNKVLVGIAGFLASFASKYLPFVDK
jgi:hypothetical protein